MYCYHDIANIVSRFDKFMYLPNWRDTKINE